MAIILHGWRFDGLGTPRWSAPLWGSSAVRVPSGAWNSKTAASASRFRPRGNSGIHLRGGYEVQIEDNFGEEPESHKIGGIYGFLTPSVNAAKKAGEWQTLDITLVGRVVTVVLNGERVIDRQTIPGITGGAIDSDEGGPGPILLQGDHGPIEFRRVTVTAGK